MREERDDGGVTEERCATWRLKAQILAYRENSKPAGQQFRNHSRPAWELLPAHLASPKNPHILPRTLCPGAGGGWMSPSQPPPFERHPHPAGDEGKRLTPLVAVDSIALSLPPRRALRKPASQPMSRHESAEATAPSTKATSGLVLRAATHPGCARQEPWACVVSILERGSTLVAKVVPELPRRM